MLWDREDEKWTRRHLPWCPQVRYYNLGQNCCKKINTLWQNHPPHPCDNIETWNCAPPPLTTPTLKGGGRGGTVVCKKVHFITLEIKKIQHFKRADFQIFFLQLILSKIVVLCQFVLRLLWWRLEMDMENDHLLGWLAFYNWLLLEFQYIKTINYLQVKGQRLWPKQLLPASSKC